MASRRSKARPKRLERGVARRNASSFSKKGILVARSASLISAAPPPLSLPQDPYKLPQR